MINQCYLVLPFRLQVLQYLFVIIVKLFQSDVVIPERRFLHFDVIVVVSDLSIRRDDIVVGDDVFQIFATDG